MGHDLVAVKAGTVFNLFDQGLLAGIPLTPEGVNVIVDGVTYPLWRAKTYEDSRRIDNLLDMYGEKSIRDHLEEP
ncbi:hypothetical protein [Bifidobacterium felsineum]|uniref:hypothetical protein n=1 Tax=Bifidobacterium felsineum TaxID=2045440 RepID=UPI001BDBE9F2|nr:hypothetical protein [Bifidobacterium felsineum]MBT1164613.1 hypothetical protein [Bifidobacterium felsineum]